MKVIPFISFVSSIHMYCKDTFLRNTNKDCNKWNRVFLIWIWSLISKYYLNPVKPSFPIFSLFPLPPPTAFAPLSPSLPPPFPLIYPFSSLNSFRFPFFLSLLPVPPFFPHPLLLTLLIFPLNSRVYYECAYTDTQSTSK